MAAEASTAGTPRRRVGRPRAAAAAPHDADPREQLLAAAAELFTVQGYTATSTRAITARAGMRQASMYYHFDSKEALLQTLLETTVAPSLDFALWAVGEDAASPEARLWALARIDVAGLAGTGRNLGALYLLPEVRRPAFAPFRELRERLRNAYRELLSLTAVGQRLEPAEVDLRTRLVFGLVESVILARQDDTPVPDPVDFSMRVADGALRLAETPDLEAVRDEGRRLCSTWMERTANGRTAAELRLA